MILAFLLSMALSIPAMAQSVAPDDNVFVITNPKDCGLITRLSPAQIPAGCLQDVKNAYFDFDGTLLRRDGYTAYNLTACTGAQSIRGVWPFNSTDGTKYLIAYSSQSMFFSSGDGNCNQINGLSGLSATADMECTQAMGRIWCTNGTDSVFSWDGTSTQTISGAPLGTHIGSFRNRILVAGVSGNLTQLYLSKEFDGTTWGLNLFPNNSNDPAIIDISGANDGLKINCLMGEYQNQFLIGRDYDLYALAGYDNRDFTMRRISEQIGCIEPKSVQEVNNVLYWVSKRGVEALSGSRIDPVSYFVYPTVKQIISASGNTRSQLFKTQSDWNSGNLTASGAGAAMSATISPGNVVPTSWSVTTGGLNPNNFEMIGVDTTVYVSGTIDNFDTNSLTTPIVWTTDPSASYSGGRWYVADHVATATTTKSGGVTQAMSTPITDATGTWSFGFVSTGTTGVPALSFYLMADSNSLATTGKSYRVTIQPSQASLCVIGFGDVCSGFVTANLSDGTTHYFTVQRGTNGYTALFIDGAVKKTLTDLRISTGGYVIVYYTDNGTNVGPQTHIGYFHFPAFYTSQASIAYDTGLATPTYSYQSSFSSSTLSSTTFNTQTSNTASGGYSSLVSVTPGGSFSSPQREFIRHQIIYNAPESVTASSVTSVTLTARTTGYYITPCITVSTPSSWGNLNVNGVNNGGSFTFYMSTGANCALATATTAPWVQQSPGAQITVSTATTATAVRVLFTIDVGTEVPTLNNITVNWNTGSNRPPVASGQYLDRYYLFYTTNTIGSPKNDHALVYDYNQKWTLLEDINAYSAATYLNSLYLGDSAATGKIYQFDTGESDNGGSYTFSFKTGDMDMGNPSQLKQFERAYMYLSAASQSGQNVSLACSYNIDGSTTSYSLGSVNLNEAAEQSGYFNAKLPFPIGTTSLAHWISMSCTYTGTDGPVRIHGIRLIYKNLSWD